MGKVWGGCRTGQEGITLDGREGRRTRCGEAAGAGIFSDDGESQILSPPAVASLPLPLLELMPVKSLEEVQGDPLQGTLNYEPPWIKVRGAIQ